MQSGMREGNQLKRSLRLGLFLPRLRACGSWYQHLSYVSRCYGMDLFLELCALGDEKHRNNLRAREYHADSLTRPTYFISHFSHFHLFFLLCQKHLIRGQQCKRYTDEQCRHSNGISPLCSYPETAARVLRDTVVDIIESSPCSRRNHVL